MADNYRRKRANINGKKRFTKHREALLIIHVNGFFIIMGRKLWLCMTFRA